MREKSSTLVLYTRPAEFSKLELFIEQISDEYNIGHTYFSNIIVTLTELVKNAMIHGNKGKPYKKVLIEFKNIDGKLTFAVTDEGKGFGFPVPEASDFQSDPRVKNGLQIVYALSDGLEFNASGNEITVSFDIAAANELLSRSRMRSLSGSQQKVENK
jgi:serine/threonine-protein kinase RsbW